VVLSVTPHPWFRREGRNVVLDLPLSLREATLGAHLDVPTIDGMVQLAVPAGSASGQRLRLKERGAGSSHGGPRGDQIVVLQIVTPKGIDDESRRLLDELERRNPSDPRAGLGWS
jgi:DnaJ-class molecular chaperone